MNTRKAIARADELRPNAVSEEMKASWIYELDGKVAELQGVPVPESKWPEDFDHLMPSPYDNIYELYLCAQIDNANLETELSKQRSTKMIWRCSTRPGTRQGPGGGARTGSRKAADGGSCNETSNTPQPFTGDTA